MTGKKKIRIAAVCVILLIFAAAMVYLCCAAGRDPRKEGIRAGGMNRIPLDLYALGSGSVIICTIFAGFVLAGTIMAPVFALSPIGVLYIIVAALAFIPTAAGLVLDLIYG